jgi:hypothetical protein
MSLGESFAKDCAYVFPETIEAAIQHLGRGSARIIAGGTDLLPDIRKGKVHAGCLVDITRIPGLDRITVTDEYVLVGAAVTLADIKGSEVIKSQVQALAEAATSVGALAIQNAATWVGNIAGPEALVEDIRWNTAEFTGAILQPIEAWLMLLFLETLQLRMNQHSLNTQRVAEFLEDHPQVSLVNYPGLPGHPQHELGKRQMKASGGLLSFVVLGGMQAAARVMNNFNLIVHAVTFGTSRTICMHPRTITHEHMTDEERREAGVDDGLIRLSVGLEEAEDIIADLDRALACL